MVELEESDSRIGMVLHSGGDIHVYPINTKTEPHVLSDRCWCEPEIDHVADDGTKVWVHRGVQ